MPERDERMSPSLTPALPATERPPPSRCSASGSTRSTTRSWPSSTSAPRSPSRSGASRTRPGRRTVRDAQRETEVLERVTSASAGLFPEPELAARIRKLIAATAGFSTRRSARPAARAGGAEASTTTEAAWSATAFGTAPRPREE